MQSFAKQAMRESAPQVGFESRNIQHSTQAEFMKLIKARGGQGFPQVRAKMIQKKILPKINTEIPAASH
jgi:hypothetical protein